MSGLFGNLELLVKSGIVVPPRSRNSFAVMKPWGVGGAAAWARKPTNKIVAATETAEVARKLILFIGPIVLMSEQESCFWSFQFWKSVYVFTVAHVNVNP